MGLLVVYSCLIASTGYGYIWPSTCDIPIYKPYSIRLEAHTIFEESTFDLSVANGDSSCIIDDYEDVCYFDVFPYGPVIIKSGIGFLKVQIQSMNIQSNYLPIIYDN